MNPTARTRDTSAAVAGRKRAARRRRIEKAIQTLTDEGFEREQVGELVALRGRIE
jgi:biotin operon repressor